MCALIIRSQKNAEHSSKLPPPCRGAWPCACPAGLPPPDDKMLLSQKKRSFLKVAYGDPAGPPHEEAKLLQANRRLAGGRHSFQASAASPATRHGQKSALHSSKLLQANLRLAGSSPLQSCGAPSRIGQREELQARERVAVGGLKNATRSAVRRQARSADLDRRHASA